MSSEHVSVKTNIPVDSRPYSRVYNCFMAQSGIQIGDLAKRASVSVDTVRFYERRRLLSPATRTSGGFRLFTPEVVERIRFIKEAQELGFSLEEIKSLLATGGADECRKVRDLLCLKLSELDDRLKAMKSFRRVLRRQLAACEQELERHGESACCPVVVGAKGATETESDDVKKTLANM
jgi:MerR family mercuric resistance operon transcriptional regulator